MDDLTGTEPNPSPRRVGLGRMLVILFGYFAAGGLTLLIARIPGDIGEGLCGVWGCFPPIQALISMHLLWCVVAVATVHYVVTRNRGDIRLEGVTLMLLSAGAMVIILGRDLVRWMSLISPEHAEYWPRRLGYTLAIHSDWPLVPMFVAGMVCFGIGWRRRGNDRNHR